MTTVNEIMALVEPHHNDDAQALQLKHNLKQMAAELEAAKEHLVFIERVAVHHGSKSFMTPEQALSTIQHYPPISRITKSYRDGKVPETRNPWQELEAAKAEIERRHGIGGELIAARRERDALQAKLDALEKQEPVLEVVRMPDHWHEGHFYDDGGSYISERAIRKLPIGTKLFAAAGAAHKEQQNG